MKNNIQLNDYYTYNSESGFGCGHNQVDIHFGDGREQGEESGYFTKGNHVFYPDDRGGRDGNGLLIRFGYETSCKAVYDIELYRR